MAVGESGSPLEKLQEIPPIKGSMGYFITSKDKKDVSVAQSACMGWMSSFRTDLRPETLRIFVPAPTEAEKKLQEEVLNTGPSAEAFITKDVEEGLAKGFEMRVDLPYVQILFSIQCLREITFGDDLGHTYGKLWNLVEYRSEGATVHEALALASSVYYDPSSGKMYGPYGTYDHAPYSRYVNMSEVNEPIVFDKELGSLNEKGFVLEKRVTKLFPETDRDTDEILREILPNMDNSNQNIKTIVEKMKQGVFN